jgi:endonuclease YncB( thermonuclease family)
MPSAKFGGALRVTYIVTVSIAVALLAGHWNAHADALVGKVVGITDGDTIMVQLDRHEVKVRVSGIDAPEKMQPFGQRSKEHLSDCAFGKTVTIEWKKVDR